MTVTYRSFEFQINYTFIITIIVLYAYYVYKNVQDSPSTLCILVKQADN